MCSSKKYLYPPHGRTFEILREGVAASDYGCITFLPGNSLYQPLSSCKEVGQVALLVYKTTRNNSQVEHKLHLATAHAVNLFVPLLAKHVQRILPLHPLPYEYLFVTIQK